MAAFAVAACATRPEPTESAWPPPDFLLRVRGGVDRPASVGTRQACDVLPDGLVVYREVADADRDRDGPPVFRRVCAYRLAPESLRMLSRLLNRAGLLEARSPVAEELTGEWVSLVWRMQGNDGQAVVRGRIYGPLVRVLHVVNAFLPADKTFHVGAMGGDPEPRRVQDVPQPVESLEGSLAFHLELLERLPEDTPWLLDTFALAVAAHRREVAAQLLQRLEARRAQPFADEEAGLVIEDLRRLLEG